MHKSLLWRRWWATHFLLLFHAHKYSRIAVTLKESQKYIDFCKLLYHNNYINNELPRIPRWLMKGKRVKIIKCQVRCQYWDRPDSFEIEVPDDATEKQIEDEMREAALNAAGFDFWRED